MIKKPNLHTVDRIARTLVGAGCIYAGFIEGSIISNGIVSALVGVFGVINLGAAFFSFCPIYSLAGISTKSQDS